MPDRADVIAEMELLGIGREDKRIHKKPNGLNGSNGSPVTTEAAILAHRIAIEEISEMADKMNSRIQDIRERTKSADEALVELEISLASLNTEED